MNSKHEHAIAYAALGWAILPLKTRDKAPRTRHGVKDASAAPYQIDEWWSQWPDANIGIACGEPSGIVVLDVDPRNGGDATLESLLAKSGPLPETVTALTGGGGQHYVFRWAPGVASAKLGPGLELLSTWKYFVAAPSVHPDTGAEYDWEASSAPGMVEIAELPHWLRPSTLGAAEGAAEGQASACLDDQLEADMRSALSAIPGDVDRDTWVRLIMAVNDAAPNDLGYKIADDWSKTGAEKYSAEALRKLWRSIKPNGKITYRTVFAVAKDYGWVNSRATHADPAQDEIEQMEPWVSPVADSMPDDLYRIPGKLQDVVDYLNESAWIPQPGFAVLGALATGSALLSRRYFDGVGAPAMLWLLAVGESGCGKDSNKDAIEALLAESGNHRLLNSGGYTAKESVLAALLRSPAHITFKDEAGKWMSSAKKDGKGMQEQVVTQLMQCSGRQSGAIQQQQYARGDSPRRVLVPSVTLYMMTTPGDFYSALSPNDIRGGFIPRVISYETHITHNPDFFPMEDKAWSGPPRRLVEWVSKIRPAGVDGNLSGLQLGELPPSDTVIIPLTVPVRMRYKELSQLQCMDRAKRQAGELYNRMTYLAQCVAVVIAGFNNPSEPEITLEIADWACRYVLELKDREYEACVGRVSDTRHGASVNNTLAYIRSQPGGVVTKRMLMRTGKALRWLTATESAGVRATLVSAGQITVFNRGQSEFWQAVSS